MTPSEPEFSRFARGMSVLSEVHGPNAEAALSDFGDLERYVVEFALGDIWSRPGLALRDRSLITVSALAALGGRQDQLDIHLRGALNLGVTADELREAMIHLVPYAGFPSAINGLKRLAAVNSERATELRLCSDAFGGAASRQVRNAERSSSTSDRCSL